MHDLVKYILREQRGYGLVEAGIFLLLLAVALAILLGGVR